MYLDSNELVAHGLKTKREKSHVSIICYFTCAPIFSSSGTIFYEDEIPKQKTNSYISSLMSIGVMIRVGWGTTLSIS